MQILQNKAEAVADDLIKRGYCSAGFRGKLINIVLDGIKNGGNYFLYEDENRQIHVKTKIGNGSQG